MKVNSVSGILLAASAALVTTANGTMVSVIPIADTFVTSGSADANAGVPTGNYGGAGGMEISPAGATKGEMQTLLKFDLSSVKTSFDTTFGAGNWVIDSITLQLGTNMGVAGSQPMNLIFNSISAGAFKFNWQSNDNWGEGSGNPMNPFIPTNPPVDGATYNTIGSLESGSDETLGTFTYAPAGNNTTANYVLGLTSGFLSDVTAGNNVSLRGYADSTSTVGYLFNARTFASGKPTLIVDAVAAPEPGVAALLAVGAIVGLRRKRRAVASMGA